MLDLDQGQEAQCAKKDTSGDSYASNLRRYQQVEWPKQPGSQDESKDRQIKGLEAAEIPRGEKSLVGDNEVHEDDCETQGRQRGVANLHRRCTTTDRPPDTPSDKHPNDGGEHEQPIHQTVARFRGWPERRLLVDRRQ